MQPTASKTDLLLECSYPFDPAHTLEPSGSSEPARYGSAFHELLAKSISKGFALPTAREVGAVAKRFEVGADELKEHVGKAAPTLSTWLGGKNPWGHAWGQDLRIEESYAWAPEKASTRCSEPPTEDHIYPGLGPREMGMTVDLWEGRRAHLLVLDHKTGEDSRGNFSQPERLPQLLSLAAAITAMAPNDPPQTIVVAVFHARRRGLPIVYSEQVDADALSAHALKVHTALARIGDRSMRPGPWCVRCPARAVCPAQDAELLSKAEALLGGLHGQGSNLLTTTNIAGTTGTALSREKRWGQLYALAKKSDALAGRVRTELKKEMLADARLLPEVPGEGVLTLQKRTVERLSKSTLDRNLGKLQAEREKTRLRKMGAMDVAEETVFHVEKAR